MIGRARVLEAGAPDTVAEIVTLPLPSGVAIVVFTVMFTVAGAEVVTAGFGLSKVQLTPTTALLQASITTSLNAPWPVTCIWICCELNPCTTCTLVGDGGPSAKSTTCKSTGASWVTVLASLPTPWTLKE